MKTYTEEFELFWSAAPRRHREGVGMVKCDKWGAFVEWQKLDNEDKISALQGIVKVPEGKYTPDARKWLRHRGWEDLFIAPARPQNIKSQISDLVNKLSGKMNAKEQKQKTMYVDGIPTKINERGV